MTGFSALLAILELSSDGRELTIATISAGPPVDGATSPETFRRIGPGSGLAGRWRSTNLGVNVANTISLSDAGGGRVQWGSPADGNFYVVVPDGPPAANQGRTSVPGVTLVVTRRSATELHWTESIAGNPYTIGSDTLAKSGHTLTEVSRPAHSPAEKQTAVYRR